MSPRNSVILTGLAVLLVATGCTSASPAPTPVIVYVTAVPSPSLEPTPAPTPTLTPLDSPLNPTKLRSFLQGWATNLVACYGSLIPLSLDASLGADRGSCSPDFTNPDGPKDTGAAMLWDLMQSGPSFYASPGYERLRGTCPGIWLETAHALRLLDRSADRAFFAVRFPSVHAPTEFEASLVTEALTFLSSAPTVEDCADLPDTDLVSLRFDIAADMKHFDREFGAWFGRDGGRSRDFLAASAASRTWEHREERLLDAFVAIRVLEAAIAARDAADAADAGLGAAGSACDGALDDAYHASGWLSLAAKGLWGWLAKIKDYGSDDPWDESFTQPDLNEALDRTLPEALYVLEHCVST